MKKFIIFLFTALIVGNLSGCGTSSVESVSSMNKASPANYMNEIKQEVHDELFREQTDNTQEIVDRIFKHLEVEALYSSVNGDESTVLMAITTVNAGKAWIHGLEEYATLCAENLFSESYVDDATLYSCYLKEFEKAVKNAEYIIIPITIDMEYNNHRWEWDINDDVVNAITGNLLDAINGDMNSYTIAMNDYFNSADILDSEEVSLGMRNAFKSAELYAKLYAYSRIEMKDALAEDGFTDFEIEYALKSVGY